MWKQTSNNDRVRSSFLVDNKVVTSLGGCRQVDQVIVSRQRTEVVGKSFIRVEARIYVVLSAFLREALSGARFSQQTLNHRLVDTDTGKKRFD